MKLSAVQDDTLGRIEFTGYSENDSQYKLAALIRAVVDGEPDTGDDETDMPGKLIFSTTSDGSGGVTDRMTIGADGNLSVVSNVTASRFISDTTTNSPFQVSSTIKVTNLNADLLDGISSGSFLRSLIKISYIGQFYR